MAGRMQKIAPIRTHTVLAEDEKVIGMHGTQQIIQRTFTREVAHDVLDKNGEQVWKLNHMGIPTVKVRELKPEQVTEVYVYHEVNGQNYKNHDFRPGPDELDKREKRARVEALRENFFEEAEELGMDPKTLARGFQERYSEPAEATSEPVPDPEAAQIADSPNEGRKSERNAKDRARRAKAKEETEAVPA